MRTSHTLGELQLAIMRILWEEGEATVARVHEALPGDRPRALTTIATMLTKMEKKGVVKHRTEGRQFVFLPTITEDAVTRSMVADLTQRLFSGNVTELVSHLLQEQEIDGEELNRLRALIAQRAKEEGNDGR